MEQINEELNIAIRKRVTAILILSKLEYTKLYDPIDKDVFTIIKGWLLGKISKELFPYRDSQELKNCFANTPEHLIYIRENILSSESMDFYQEIMDLLDNSIEEHIKQ